MTGTMKRTLSLLLACGWTTLAASFLSSPVTVNPSVGLYNKRSTRTQANARWQGAGASPDTDTDTDNDDSNDMVVPSTTTMEDISSEVASVTATQESEEQYPVNLKFASTRCIRGVVARAGPLNEAVARIANITSLEMANDLIKIGAVWAKMETLKEEDLLALYDDDNDSSSSRALYADLGSTSQSSNSYWGKDDGQDEEADLDKYIEKMENQRYRRILTPSWIDAGTDIRVYPEPRRFPSCYDFTPERLVYEDTTFIVVDKPPMLPTQPDSSNYFECCPGCVQEMYGPFKDIQEREIPRPLLCHRVDACVGGCVVLSKDRNGQKVFNELQRERKLRKLYLAVTTEPVPLGMHLHWMWAEQSARGKAGGPPCQLVSHAPPDSRRKAREFWNRCVLEVTKCEPIEITKGENGHTYDPAGKQHYQSTIRLVTGRKHQVRAQLSSLGCPIIRDSLYEPMAGVTLGDLELEEEIMDAAVAKCRVPTEPIGLQAHAILFGGIRAKARTPWWGDGTSKQW
jgi:23S rRNA-/tRNA-specific pseudouridylate synthase